MRLTLTMVAFAERLAYGGARKLLTGDDGRWVNCPVCLESMDNKTAYIFGCNHHECADCHVNRVRHARMTSIDPQLQCSSCRADIGDDIFKFLCKTTREGTSRRLAIRIDVDVSVEVVSSTTENEDAAPTRARPKRKRRKRIEDLAFVCAALASTDDDGSDTECGSDTEWHKACRRRACTGDRRANRQRLRVVNS